MINSGLLICSFFLKKRFSKGTNNIVELNNCIKDEYGNEYKDVWSLFNIFLNSSNDTTDDEKNMKLFSVDKTTIKNHSCQIYNAISFVVCSGSYGLESEMTDRKTGNINYKRTPDDADIKRFFCLVYIPKDVDGVNVQKGIMLFQTLSTYGIKTITSKQMKEFFSQKGLTLEMRSVSVRVFIEKIIEKSALKKVTLVKNKVSPDSSDNMFISKGREEKSYIRPIIKETWFKKFLDYLDGKHNDDIFEINDEKYEDIRITFSLSGKSRTVKISDVEKFSVVEEIPDTIFKNGKYSLEEIPKYMLEIASSYKERMVFVLQNEVE